MELMSHCITVGKTGNDKTCLILLSIDLWTSYLLYRLTVVSSFVDLTHLNNGVVDFSFNLRKDLKKKFIQKKNK